MRDGRDHSSGVAARLASNANRLLVAIVIGAGTSGCAMWPTMKNDSGLVGADNGRLECHLTKDLPHAYACIAAAKEELEGMLDDVGKYQLAMGYTAVTGGTAAGYQLVQSTPNMTAVKNTGVILASLVGINSVVGADGQRQALVAGIKALSCVERAGRAMELTGQRMQALRQNAGFRIASADIQAKANALSTQMFGGSSAQAASTFFARFEVAASSQDKLTEAVRAASDPALLADRLRAAMAAIRSSVRAQLLSRSVDLQQIFKDQQQRVGQLVGEVVANGQKAKQDADAARVLYQLSGSTPPADEHQAAAKPAKDSYEECVATLPS